MQREPRPFTVRRTQHRLFSTILLFLFFSVAGQSFAQFGKGANQGPTPVALIVRLFIGNLTSPAPAGIAVQLLDHTGVLEKELRTDGGGEVHFQTVTTDHNLRIYGPGIEEVNMPLEIDPIQTHMIQTVMLRPTGEGGASIAGLTIPAARLKIPKKAAEEFQKGGTELQKNDWPEAKKHFDAAIAIYPDYDLAYNGVGSVALATNDMTGARAAFEKAIALNANFAEAYRNLARVSVSEHKYEEADDLLTKSLKADPQNVRALVYAANAELLAHRYDAAIAHAQKAHALQHPGLAGVHIVAARALEANNQPKEAVGEYKLYLAEDPKGRDVGLANDALTRLAAVQSK